MTTKQHINRSASIKDPDGHHSEKLEPYPTSKSKFRVFKAPNGATKGRDRSRLGVMAQNGALEGLNAFGRRRIAFF
jgi:hypothetical protein